MPTHTAARQKKYEKGRIGKQEHQQQTGRTVWKGNSSKTEEICNIKHQEYFNSMTDSHAVSTRHKQKETYKSKAYDNHDKTETT